MKTWKDLRHNDLFTAEDDNLQFVGIVSESGLTVTGMVRSKLGGYWIVLDTHTVDFFASTCIHIIVPFAGPAPLELRFKAHFFNKDKPELAEVDDYLREKFILDYDYRDELTEEKGTNMEAFDYSELKAGDFIVCTRLDSETAFGIVSNQASYAGFLLGSGCKAYSPLSEEIKILWAVRPNHNRARAEMLELMFQVKRGDAGLGDLESIFKDKNRSGDIELLCSHDSNKVKEMTVEEISKALGYEVKVVK